MGSRSVRVFFQFVSRAGRNYGFLRTGKDDFHEPPSDRINPMRSEEARLRNIAATRARRQKRYATDAEFRAKVIADAKAWYYANREAVLERHRLNRQALCLPPAARSAPLVTSDPIVARTF
jgi:hypothetical protein